MAIIYNDADSFIVQKSRAFAMAGVNSMAIPQVSATQINDARQLAATFNAVIIKDK